MMRRFFFERHPTQTVLTDNKMLNIGRRKFPSLLKIPSLLNISVLTICVCPDVQALEHFEQLWLNFTSPKKVLFSNPTFEVVFSNVSFRSQGWWKALVQHLHCSYLEAAEVRSKEPEFCQHRKLKVNFQGNFTVRTEFVFLKWNFRLHWNNLLLCSTLKLVCFFETSVEWKLWGLC